MSGLIEIAALEAALRDTPIGLRNLGMMWEEAHRSGDWRDVSWYLTGALCSCPVAEYDDYKTVLDVARMHRHAAESWSVPA